MNHGLEPEHDYIVIGSGAGGGTIAARLAEAGQRVLVIEAGPDPRELAEAQSRADYRVPAFHAAASEDPSFSWPYFVSHFDDPAALARDRNASASGIFYPRAAALGGCTAHNAMIFLPPPDADWDRIAALTGDAGWSAEAMRRHRRTVEACRHRPMRRLLALLGLDRTGHGWRGWLSVERAMPLKAVGDLSLMRMLARLAWSDLTRNPRWLDRLRTFLGDWGDPNDRRRGGAEQLCYLPLATRRHARTGTRERLRSVARAHPANLEIRTDTIATELLFNGGRVSGIAWQRGRGLHRDPARPPDAIGVSHAAREVIVAAGSFATPQLLMLSGIGDPAALAQLGVAVRVASPEVGRNLQDRYEIGVVHRMATPWASLRGARFSTRDPLYRRWRWLRRGMYISNGGALAALRRSGTACTDDPDLALMALLGRFSGYREGYAPEVWAGLDGLTWAILKGRTRNRAGTVTLVSRDIRVPPRIAFRNFAEGGDADLDALIEGVEMARALTAPLKAVNIIASEELPGDDMVGEQLRTWVKDNAWGHHACGTAAMGTVLDGQCCVRGAPGLRVVDASIFPEIPGLFIAAAVMLAAEKVADDILQGDLA